MNIVRCFHSSFYGLLIIFCTAAVLTISQGISRAGGTYGGSQLDDVTQQPPPSFRDIIKGRPQGPADNRNYWIQVYIRMTDVSMDSLNQIRAAGASITHVSARYNTVTAYIQPEHRARLNRLRVVLNIQQAEKPILNNGTGPVGTGPFHN